MGGTKCAFECNSNSDEIFNDSMRRGGRRQYWNKVLVEDGDGLKCPIRDAIRYCTIMHYRIRAKDEDEEDIQMQW